MDLRNSTPQQQLDRELRRWLRLDEDERRQFECELELLIASNNRMVASLALALCDLLATPRLMVLAARARSRFSLDERRAIGHVVERALRGLASAA